MITNVPRFIVTRAWMTAPLSTIWAAVLARLIKPAVIAESCTRSSGFDRSETATETPSEVITAARRMSGTRSVKPARSWSRSCWPAAGSWACSSAILARLLRTAVHLGRHPGPARPSLEAGEPAPRDLRRPSRRGLRRLLVGRDAANAAGLRRLLVGRDAANAAGLRHTLRQPGGGRAIDRRRPGDGTPPDPAAHGRGPGYGTFAAVSKGCRPAGRRPRVRRLAGLWITGPQTLAVAGFDGLEYGQPAVRLRAHRLSHRHTGGGLWGRGRHRRGQQ